MYLCAEGLPASLGERTMRRIVLTHLRRGTMRRIVPSYHGRIEDHEAHSAPLPWCICLPGGYPMFTLPTHHGTLATPCPYPIPCSTVMQQQASRCTEEGSPGSG